LPGELLQAGRGKDECEYGDCRLRASHGCARAALTHETALRKSASQRACFILLPRAQGLDRWPMSGFPNALVDAESFPDGRYRGKFLPSIRYGERASLRPPPAQLGSAAAAAGL
jgi:hypothetical protein